MSNELKHIVIVGGGSAGWIAAGTLAAAHHANKSGGIKVTLIESPDVNTIGVGEGTWPTMRNTLRNMGVSETDFMRECDASFKQGAKFAKWVTGADDDFYYHPLVLPQGYFEVDLFKPWKTSKSSSSFSNAVCYQEQLCEHDLAPKLISTPEYAAVANYSYHLDAGKFAEFLKNHCTKNLGVTHILDHVSKINSADNGDIASVSSVSHGDISGDLFIDCTGFSSLLIGKHYNVPKVCKKDILFIDTALAVQIPYGSDDSPIASHTISTAQEAGWIWDIGLPTRRGVGHVYSSKHTSQERSEQLLREYLAQSIGDKANDLSFRKIDINPGVREKFWVNNCVAVGMSAGFLEPLEASALVMIELACASISEQLPANRETMDIVAKSYNDKFQYNWDRVIDFLKLHYTASKRDDTAFWRDNRDPATIPESLQELMALWQHRSPSEYDFQRKREMFSAASYQYVLYGMDYNNAAPDGFISDDVQIKAQRMFAENEKLTKRYVEALPTNRELINKVRQFGFNKV
ncbi:tryptophan halogenase family protein [Thalassotalea fonticola]|uniref:Tryptophan halogenase family protein n=1 Tax=Thalassotalea fonticola TaxID=3065649 RepID=A0ABZ0GTI2_9GAMM|nr:tryptophan halogenase family protein [Colwelliaceae bacterium S1-1]